MLSLRINGQPRELELDGETNLKAALDHIGVQADRVAVELNGEIVSRKLWDREMLRNGDSLEIVHFVGGGTNSPSTASIYV